MKVLVTGANGMLGREVCAAFSLADHDVAAFGKHEFNVVKADMVREIITRETPHFVIHCAAYTNVNRAESEEAEAFSINEGGTRNVADACREIGAKMVYVSTDFVFDGTKNAPYTEADKVNPLNVYGKSKEAGERAVREILPDNHVIARTAWLYGSAPHAKNFVRTIHKLARHAPTLPVVCDQMGSPTCAAPVAQMLVRLAEDFMPGTYHVVCEGEASWFEFAREIVQGAGLPSAVVPVTAESYAAQFGNQAPRPAYSVLDNTALKKRGFFPMPPWKAALQAFLQANPDL